MRTPRITLALALALTLVALPVAAEVWNDSGGVAVTDTSQTITFPRIMSSLLVLNDDATNEVYIRLFACGDTAAAATTSSLEIKATKSRSIPHNANTQAGLGWCAISLVCAAAETATVRLEGN